MGEYMGAWLVSALGSNRVYGGNDGYDDVPDATYVWDSNVHNASGPRQGDYMLVRNKHKSLGLAVIDLIDTWDDSKTLKYCPNPNCGKSEINERRTLRPVFRCGKCKTEFDNPVTRTVPVTKYEADYGTSWMDLDGVLSFAELRAMCVSPGTQHSIREIHWDQLEAKLKLRGVHIRPMKQRSRVMKGGRRVTSVKVRYGQSAFRAGLVATYGLKCAFTGDSPADALDAAHLYSFAKEEEHHEHGGLLLRKDLHRLFDRGIIAINPSTLEIDCPELAAYPNYRGLHGKSLAISIHDGQLQWIHDHWDLHRP